MILVVSPSSLGQSHASATAGAWPYRVLVLYLSMWAFFLGWECLRFKPHWMFQIYLRGMKNSEI